MPKAVGTTGNFDIVGLTWDSHKCPPSPAISNNSAHNLSLISMNYLLLSSERSPCSVQESLGLHPAFLDTPEMLKGGNACLST